MRLSNQQIMLVVGALIVITANVIVLAGVAYNRSGQPVATISLTERELQLPYKFGLDKENSGINLHIVFNKEDVGKWFDREKLIELGFSLSDSSDLESSNYKRKLPRKAFIVLEYAGSAYQHHLAKLKKEFEDASLLVGNDSGGRNVASIAENKWKTALNSASRLYVIDAALEHDHLREKYPDTNNFLILPSKVSAYKVSSKKFSWVEVGSVGQLLVNRINIPVTHRDVISSMKKYRSTPSHERFPRYTVNLAFGKRYEPWVENISLIQE